MSYQIKFFVKKDNRDFGAGGYRTLLEAYEAIEEYVDYDKIENLRLIDEFSGDEYSLGEVEAMLKADALSTKFRKKYGKK